MDSILTLRSEIYARHSGMPAISVSRPTNGAYLIFVYKIGIYTSRAPCAFFPPITSLPISRFSQIKRYLLSSNPLTGT